MNQGKVIDYYVVTANGPDELQEEMKALLNKGWQPHGSMQTMLHKADAVGGNQYVYAQPMVLHEKLDLFYAVVYLPLTEKKEEQAFLTEANDLVEHGWEPIGGPAFSDFNVIQAFVQRRPRT